MTLPETPTPAPQATHARDLQLALYREIGISAVAAALRFTTQPDPLRATPVEKKTETMYTKTDVAA